MKAVKFIIPLFILLFLGCKIFKKESKEVIHTGIVSLSELKEYKWFNIGYRKHHYSKKSIEDLKILNQCKIKIVGGNWCSDTRTHLPGFIKILETIKFPMENLQVFFVDRAKECSGCKDYSKEKLDVKLVPTFIVYNGMGQEIGRIIETPTKTLEEDLLLLFNGKSPD